MRKIMFRGKRITDRKWVYGHYMGVCGHGVIVYYYRPEEGIVSKVVTSIDNDTLCQFTGLRDRNQRDVYEGDIVRCKTEDDVIDGIVVWVDKACVDDEEKVFHVGWYLEYLKNDVTYLCLPSMIADGEVVGDIYEEGGKK